MAYKWFLRMQPYYNKQFVLLNLLAAIKINDSIFNEIPTRSYCAQFFAQITRLPRHPV